MRRDKLELADDSLFIERRKGRFAAADAEHVNRAHAFLSENACANDSTAHKAAALLIEQDADANMVEALPPPLLWQECIAQSEIRKRFRSTVAATVEDLSSPFISTTNDRQRPCRDVQAILSSVGCVPHKALLFISIRLIALQTPIGSSGMFDRKSAAVDLTFEDRDSIEVIANGVASTSETKTSAYSVTGYDSFGSKYLFKEDYNGKKLLRNS